MATSTLPVVQTQFSSLATDPLRNFKFLVQINKTARTGVGAGNQTFSMATLGFTSVSGLSVTTESIPYRQGGYNTTVHQIPGQTTFTPITLQGGVLLGGGASAWFWMKELFSVIAGSGTGAAGNNFRADHVDILVLDHPVTSDGGTGGQGVSTPVKLRFRVYNAWITALSFSDLNAGDNALLVQQMTLVHEGFDMKWAGTAPTASAATFTH